MHGGPGSDKDADEKDRVGVKQYSINCSASGGSIIGTGSGKINGNYTLIAIPNLGYKCDWMVKQVTVKDADVTDCNLSCSEILPIPTPPGDDEPEPEPEPEPDPTPGDDDDDDDDDDDKDNTYCINITVTGEEDKCTVSGAGCGKEDGQSYTVTVTSSDKNKYTASWTSKKYTISGKDINDTVECAGSDECYSIIVDAPNCDVELPKGTCTSDTTKYVNGSYNLSVKPKEGFTYQNKTSDDPATGYSIKVNGADATAKIDCTAVANCAITFTSSGTDGGAAEGSCTVKSGKDGSENSVTLSKGTKYTGKVDSLVCGVSYSISCSGTGSGASFKLTPSPASIANLTGTQNVNVLFELAKQETGTVMFLINASSDPNMGGVRYFTVWANGPQTLSGDSSSSSSSSSYTFTDVKPGKYTNVSGNASIIYKGEIIDVVPVNWSTTGFTLESGGTVVIKGDINYGHGH